MQETNTVGLYTTVGEREIRAYDSLQPSDIGIYNEINECSEKESKALKVLREDYVSKRVFIRAVTVLTLSLIITLTILVYFIVTSKQEDVNSSNCVVKLNNNTGCGNVPNVTNGHVRIDNTSQPSSALVSCYFGYKPSKPQIKCQDNGLWELVTCDDDVIDCKTIKEENPAAQDGLYEIPLWDIKNWKVVFCDMTTDGGGWTVIQNRFDGSVDFYRNFSDYVKGFGDVEGEFWLGLKHIQKLARGDPTEIRLEMTRNNSEQGFEWFNDFKLVDGDEYRLNINVDSARRSAGISADSSFAYNNDMAFSTFDRDRDWWPAESCSQRRHGGWWYNFCTFANLNGRYCEPGTLCDDNLSGHNHRGFAVSESLLKSRMLLRRVKN